MELPAPTRIALDGLYRVESAAAGPQVRRAREVTARLLRALVDAGWPVRVVARAGKWSNKTVHYRVAHQPASTRALGIDVPVPPAVDAGARRWTNEVGWLRPAQAAALLGVHVETVARWRKAGLLPQTRKGPSGHTHEFSLEDVDAVLALRMGRAILPRRALIDHADPEAGRRSRGTWPAKASPVSRHRPPHH